MSWDAASVVLARTKEKLARKIHSYCGVEDPIVIEEDSKIDMLFHCSTELFPLSRCGRIGFHYIKIRVPRFSDFLVKPNKTSTVLEKGIDEAEEIYSGLSSIVPAVIFDLDGKYFVYSAAVPEGRNSSDHPFVHLKNHNRWRRIYELKRFLLATGMSSVEEESDP